MLSEGVEGARVAPSLCGCGVALDVLLVVGWGRAPHGDATGSGAPGPWPLRYLGERPATKSLPSSDFEAGLLQDVEQCWRPHEDGPRSGLANPAHDVLADGRPFIFCEVLELLSKAGV